MLPLHYVIRLNIQQNPAWKICGFILVNQARVFVMLISSKYCLQLYMAPVTHPDRYGESIDFWQNVYGINSEYYVYMELFKKVHVCMRIWDDICELTVVFGCSVCHVAISKTVCIWRAICGINIRWKCIDMAACGESPHILNCTVNFFVSFLLM